MMLYELCNIIMYIFHVVTPSKQIKFFNIKGGDIH